jgi:hypothetical protein
VGTSGRTGHIPKLGVRRIGLEFGVPGIERLLELAVSEKVQRIHAERRLSDSWLTQANQSGAQTKSH